MQRLLLTSVLFVFTLFIFHACAETASTEEGSQEETTGVDSVAMRRQAEDARLYARRGYADSINQGIITVDTFKSSPVRETSATVGGANIKIRYGSPGMRGRVIWGGLVGYDEVWVSGAHLATAVTFDKPIVVNGKNISAGTYALYTIPRADQWTIILNTQWNQHLADDYRQEEDAIRIDVKPIVQPQATQRLTYTIQPVTEKSGKITLTWEKLSVELPFEVTQ